MGAAAKARARGWGLEESERKCGCRCGAGIPGSCWIRRVNSRIPRQAPRLSPTTLGARPTRCSHPGASSAIHSNAVTASSPISFAGIDHVQLAAPPGCEAEARRFFVELLGLQELRKPALLAVRGGLWFQCGGQQIHIGIEKDFRPAKKAHPALRLADEASLERLRARLRAAGVKTRDDNEMAGASRFFADDPWGNRLEFVATIDPSVA